MADRFLRATALGQRSTAQESMPAAGDAPRLAEPGQNPVEEKRGDAQGWSIAVRAAIALREERQEEDGRGHRAEDEESPEDEREQRRVGHRGNESLESEWFARASVGQVLTEEGEGERPRPLCGGFVRPVTTILLAEKPMSRAGELVDLVRLA